MENKNSRQRGIEMILEGIGMNEEDLEFAEKILLLTKEIGGGNSRYCGYRHYKVKLKTTVDSEEVLRAIRKVGLDEPMHYNYDRSCIDIVFERKNNEGYVMHPPAIIQITAPKLGKK